MRFARFYLNRAGAKTVLTHSPGSGIASKCELGPPTTCRSGTTQSRVSGVGLWINNLLVGLHTLIVPGLIFEINSINTTSVLFYFCIITINVCY